MTLVMRKQIAKEALRFLYGDKGGWYRDGYTNLSVPIGKMCIEHVVPRHLLPRFLAWDLNNLLVIDTDLNRSIHVSDTKFGEDRFTFSPPENKGQVSRMCAHMLEKCNTLQRPVNNHVVIDPFLMMKWNYEYPVSDHEKYMNDYIFCIQGTYNEYIDGKYMSE